MRRAYRILLWVSFTFGLCVAGFGFVIWLADHGRDLGGVVGGAFMIGGLTLAFLAFPFGRDRKK